MRPLVIVLWLLILAGSFAVAWWIVRRKAWRQLRDAFMRRKEVPEGPIAKGATDVAQAVDAMSRAGYSESFHAVTGGLADTQGRFHRPDNLVVDDVYRFDQASDPDQQVVVYALRDPDAGIRGTYVVSYGPGASPLDTEVLQVLQAHRSS